MTFMTSYPQKWSKVGLKRDAFFTVFGKSGFLHFFKTVPPTSVTFIVFDQSLKNEAFWKTGFCHFLMVFTVFSCFLSIFHVYNINLWSYLCHIVSLIYVIVMLCCCCCIVLLFVSLIYVILIITVWWYLCHYFCHV